MVVWPTSAGVWRTSIQSPPDWSLQQVDMDSHTILTTDGRWRGGGVFGSQADHYYYRCRLTTGTGVYWPLLRISSLRGVVKALSGVRPDQWLHTLDIFTFTFLLQACLPALVSVPWVVVGVGVGWETGLGWGRRLKSRISIPVSLSPVAKIFLIFTSGRDR